MPEKSPEQAHKNVGWNYLMRKYHEAPVHRYCLTIFNDQKISCCNNAKRKLPPGAQKFGLRIFTDKIANCARIKSSLDAQK